MTAESPLTFTAQLPRYKLFDVSYERRMLNGGLTKEQIDAVSEPEPGGWMHAACGVVAGTLAGAAAAIYFWSLLDPLEGFPLLVLRILAIAVVSVVSFAVCFFLGWFFLGGPVSYRRRKAWCIRVEKAWEGREHLAAPLPSLHRELRDALNDAREHGANCPELRMAAREWVDATVAYEMVRREYDPNSLESRAAEAVEEGLRDPAVVTLAREGLEARRTYHAARNRRTNAEQELLRVAKNAKLVREANQATNTGVQA